MADQTTDDGLEILDEQDGGIGERVGDAVRRAPLVIFGVLSAVALVLIIGVVAFVRGREPAVAVPSAPVDLRAATALVEESSELTVALAEEDRFLRAVHPLLTIAEIRQTELPQGFLGPEVGQLQQAQLALGTDLRETVRRAENRSYEFDLAVSGLTAVEDATVTSYLRLTDLTTVLRERLAKLAFDERAAQQKLNAAAAGGATDGGALQALLRAREDTAMLRARLGLVDDVRGGYPSAILGLRARIAGALANREIIIRDLYAIDIDGAGIELARNGTAEQYFRSSRLPSASLRGAGSGFAGFGSGFTGFGGGGDVTGGPFGTQGVYSSLSESSSGLPMLQLTDGGPGSVPMIRLPFLSS